MSQSGPFRKVCTRLRYVILCGLLFSIAALGRAQDSNGLNCAGCHTDKAQVLKSSAHEGLSCTTCHVGIKTFPHPKDIKLPTCGQCHQRQAAEWARSAHGIAHAKGNKAAPTCQLCHGDAHQLKRTNTWAFKKSIPQLCGACHAQIYSKYEESVHGQATARGVFQAPVCTSCHTAHSVQPPSAPSSTVFPTHIPETCGQCHGNVTISRRFNLPRDRLLSYDASFHGLAVKEGSLTAANCASCHGFHLILSASNPRSTINPKNLSKTCGKCHRDAGTRFALTPVHVLPGMSEPEAVRWVRLFYLVLIPLLIGLMFVHNAGDWIRKLASLRLRRIQPATLPTVAQPAGSPALNNNVRMYFFERLQHATLLISFAVLVWTGFAFRYSTAWWARPLLAVEGGWELRAIIHRIAAVVFMAVAGAHVLSLIRSRRLRGHWLSLWPKLDDVREAFQTFAYNLGLRRIRPPRSDHNYVEKAEYWAVVWGAVLMSITGIMLWAHNWVLAWLPMVFLQLASTVHFYEAVLAALAILVWHLYSVIFDPEVYPMDPAWLTGRSVRRREGEPLDLGHEETEAIEGKKEMKQDQQGQAPTGDSAKIQEDKDPKDD